MKIQKIGFYDVITPVLYDTYDDIHGSDNDQCEAEYGENVSSDGEYDEDL